VNHHQIVIGYLSNSISICPEFLFVDGFHQQLSFFRIVPETRFCS
jgi:hypothetical protein